MEAAVRVLCSTTPMEGVFAPSIGLLTALTAQGHDVLVATSADLVDRVRSLGLRAEVAGPTAESSARAALTDPVFAQGTQPWRIGAVMFSRVMAPQKLPALIELAAAFQPDLVLHPPVDLAAPLLAAALGLPSLNYGTGLPLEPELLAEMAGWVAPLWAARGLRPDPHAGIYRGGYLDPLPPSLRPASAPPARFTAPIRPHLPGSPDDQLPDRVPAPGARPLVYVSLGTVPIFNRPEHFAPTLEALSELDVDVVVTVGPNNDPADLDRFGARVRVLRWVSLAALLPRCDAVVCHAGAGTTLAALTAGLPLLLLPRGADQFPTAAAVGRAGAGLIIPPDRQTPATIAGAVRTLLTDDTYRAASAGLRAEILSMPPPETVAAELAAGGVPVAAKASD